MNEFNLTEELEVPIFMNKFTSEITLPVFLIKSTFDETLLSAPLMLKEYIAQSKFDKEIFDLKERHDMDEVEKEYANKDFFNSQVVKRFRVVVAIILIIPTVVSIYVICKHNKLRALVTSLALQQVKEVKTEDIENKNYKCKCTTEFYMVLALSIAIIGLIIFEIIQVRRIKLCRGRLFSNVVKIMLFISDVQYYIPVKLCKTAGMIHLFKITGQVMMDKVKLNKHCIWDVLEIAIIGLIIFEILQVRRIKLCRERLFSNVVKIMLFIPDIQYYIPVKLCKAAGSIHLFKITGQVMMNKVKLNKHYIWDVLEIDLSEVKVTFNGKVIYLPKSIS